MNLKSYFIIGMCVLFIQTIKAQDRVVHGKVTTIQALPLQKVSLVLKNAKSEVLSDSNGFFTFSCDEKERITVSAQGFVPEKIKIADLEHGDSLLLDLKFKNTKKNFEIATKNGYINEKDLNYAIQRLEAGSDYSTYSNILEAIQGRVSGVSISGNSIIIRGNTSIGSGSIPALLIVDGTIVEFPVFVSIPPLEVKSIKVIKDAAASSLYGSQGMGGVVVVKTKASN
ncbi:MAG: TonB-dependent receptor plug domain-containing protein [Mariniphaga sp.]|jgi:TonB-dependent SusC/RagA subfamily outer membrane receptor|nr:TonB-dependent receptor plug domain-containing protein [Mariniphaga sp.]